MKQVNKHTYIEPTEAFNCWIDIWKEVQEHPAYVSKSIKAVEKELGAFVFHDLSWNHHAYLTPFEALKVLNLYYRTWKDLKAWLILELTNHFT